MSSMSAGVAATRSSAGRSKVASLDAYRDAVQAVAFLLGCLHDPPWLKAMSATAMPDGGAQILVILGYEDVMARRCLPTRVNGIPVLVMVDGARRR